MREEILRLLEKNSRIDIKEIAILVGKTETEVANEIAQMEKEGIIRGYYTLINWDNTNDERVSALIEVKVTPQRGIGFDKIAERISKFDEVKSVYLMSGGFDFTVILEEKTNPPDRKSTRPNSSHLGISYAVFCLKKKI